jgi:hypothetical protein
LNTNGLEVKIAYLPPSTASLLQPMDQGAISTFSAYYLRTKLMGIEIFGSNCPNWEWSSTIKRGIETVLQPYSNLLSENKKTKQISILSFLKQ